MKFEEPTSNTDISGKTKNDKTLQKITILLILKTSLSYVPILNATIKNDYTTLLSYLLAIDFDMLLLLN